MKSVKQGQKVSNKKPIVKYKPNKRVIAIAVLLALAGTVIYTMSYQYTHSAKMEVELNNRQTELQRLQQEHQNTLDLTEQQKVELENKIKQLEADLQARKAEKVRIASLAQKTAQASSTKRTTYALPANEAKAFIYQHESGNNPAAVNSIGCRGLGQACPGSKLPCSSSDYACQDAWFTNYAMSRYGSWENAYLFWVAHRWW